MNQTEEKRNRPWEWENPDPLDWEFATEGQHIKCCVLRTQFVTWCGYARLPDGHVWHRLDNEGELGIDVHGGCTFFGSLPDRSGSWVGFDTAHYRDFIPGLTSQELEEFTVYRTKDWVILETERMAAQIAKAK